MRSVKLVVVGAGLAASFSVAAFAEDLTIVSKVTSGDKPAETRTSWISSDHMRVQNPDGGEFMADYASGNITMIDGRKKEYFVMTRQEMEAASAQMQAQMKEMEAKMQSLPPEIREKMAGAMGGFAQAVDVKKGTGGRTVAGYACENWIVSMGTMVRNEQCITTELAFPTPAYDAMKSLSAGFGASNPMAKAMGPMMEKFKEMKGFPVYSSSTTSILGKTTTTVTEVAEVKKGPIPASTWEVPAGYKKVDSPMAKMLQKQR
jgi:hypothetical protein